MGFWEQRGRKLNSKPGGRASLQPRILPAAFDRRCERRTDRHQSRCGIGQCPARRFLRSGRGFFRKIARQDSNNYSSYPRLGKSGNVHRPASRPQVPLIWPFGWLAGIQYPQQFQAMRGDNSPSPYPCAQGRI